MTDEERSIKCCAWWVAWDMSIRLSGFGIFIYCAFGHRECRMSVVHSSAGVVLVNPVKGGIHFPLPATTCSMRVWWTMTSDILSAAWTSRGLYNSSTNGSPRRMRVLRICGVFGGPRASDAEDAKGKLPVRPLAVNSSA